MSKYKRINQEADHSYFFQTDTQILSIKSERLMTRFVFIDCD